MELYTELQQAVQDPSLAIITDSIATQQALNAVYVKYRVLPKRQKRFSDYYSYEFLGHTVPEMYALVKDRLKAEGSGKSQMARTLEGDSIDTCLPWPKRRMLVTSVVSKPPSETPALQALPQSGL